MISKRAMQQALVNRPVALPGWWKGSVTDLAPVAVSIKGADPIYPDALVPVIVGDVVAGVTVGGWSIILGRFATAQGWQDLAIESGFSGQAKYRRSGEWVSLRFDISGSVPNANTALTAVLPSALWPSTDGTTIYAAPSYIDPTAARAAAAVWFAADSGTLRATSGGGTAITRMRGQVSWMLG